MELVARRIVESGVDITSSYDDWVKVTLACASQGEQARESYHMICSIYPNYRHEECDKKFDNCLRTGDGSITLGTLIKMAQDAGIDTSMPRGRRPDTPEMTEEKQASKIERIIEYLTHDCQWRYNVLKGKAEFKEANNEWQSMDDRCFDTFITKLRKEGLAIQDNMLRSLIGSNEISRDWNPVEDYLNSLPAYDPECNIDYIRETFIGHMTFRDPADIEFYDMVFRHFIVGMVMLWLRRIEENPTMPVLCGPQHIGKSYFCRGLLPPQLETYVANVGPAQPMDKDTILMLSEKLLIVCDEFELSSKSKSDIFKYITSLNKSTIRRPYGRYSEDRLRQASLIGSNNQVAFIYEPDGNRRFIGVDLVGMTKLCDKPIDFQGLYSQVMYLINKKYPPHPSDDEIALIAKHNEAFLRPNDCEEALLTILRKPEEGETPVEVLVGDLMQKLHTEGFHGAAYCASNIGKTLRRMGIETCKGHRGSEAHVILLPKKGEKPTSAVNTEPVEGDLPF
ncbi:MAG: PriCT-2 domain-containing protein [Prevotella sp.]|nr:PriCT-2 domain-containing protein [Prevotella sp.]